MNTFSSILIQKRKTKHLTQKQVAEQLNITQATLSKYESGSTIPRIESLPVIADFLEMSISSLVLALLK